MEKLTHLNFAFGPGGWTKSYWRRGGAERDAYVRFKPDKRGGWKLAEIQVKNPSAENLREIPLHRMELAFNALTEKSEELREEFRAELDVDLTADLDTIFRDRFKRRPPRARLKRPAQRKLDDSFFHKVATAYRAAAIGGLNPVMTIAEEAGVPHSTAARWIAQARERKFLPPSQRGKVTA